MVMMVAVIVTIVVRVGVVVTVIHVTCNSPFQA